MPPFEKYPTLGLETRMSKWEAPRSRVTDFVCVPCNSIWRAWIYGVSVEVVVLVAEALKRTVAGSRAAVQEEVER